MNIYFVGHISIMLLSRTFYCLMLVHTESNMSTYPYFMTSQHGLSVMGQCWVSHECAKPDEGWAKQRCLELTGTLPLF